MLKVLSEFVVKVADLAEAEGRQLRAVVAAIGIGIALVIVAALVGVVGIGLLILALYKAFEEPMGPAWAACVSGVIALAIAGGVGFAGWRAMNRSKGA